MYKYFILFLVVFVNQFAFADKALDLIHVTRPEESRLDLNFYSFFFLSKDEQTSITKLANKSTLYTYDWLQKKGNTIEKKIGKLKIIIEARQKNRQGQGGSANFAILNLTNNNKKIIENLNISFDEYSGVSVIDAKSEIIIQTKAAGKISNYKIHSDINSPIKHFEDISNAKSE